jgi:hypothetical protein
MFKNRFLLITIISIFIISCSDEDNNNLAPREFDAVAVQSGFNSITFRWTESTDPENSIVKYNVYIAENIDGSEYELVAENLSEQLVADNDVINVNGESISIDPPENPEFRFAYIATNLAHNTDYKGKIVAFDQDGQTAETFFYSSTLLDNIAPVISQFNQSFVYRFNSKIYFALTDNIDTKFNWEIYLNNQLYDSILTIDPFNQTHTGIGYYFENLDENTFYSAKIIATDSNGNESNSLEFSFTTTGDTYVGNLDFIEIPQSEIDFFDDNQYTSVIGNIHIWNIGFSDSTTSSFNYIQEVYGNITIDGIATGNPETNLFSDLILLSGDLILLGVDPSNHFNNLETISGNLNMISCGQSVENNPMFENLVSVDDFYLQEGGVIYPISLNSLTTINGKLSVFSMFSTFQNLDFMINVIVINNGLEIFGNNSLTDFCGLNTVISTNGLGGYSVSENAYNPTITDIQNGNCSQ